MDRRQRLKLMELQAEPPPDDISPLALLKLIVEKAESGEMVLRDFTMNTYRDVQDVRMLDSPYAQQVLRGDQHAAIAFVMSPTYNTPSDPEKPETVTRTGARDLIFDDDAV